MKLSYLIKNMGKSVIVGLSLSTFAFGMEMVNDVTHSNVKTILEEHLKINSGLLDSSKDRDIVVFLGNTGAGKSTLINYLNGTGLEVDGFGDIVLENPKDLSAMAIGEYGDSETFLPRCTTVGDLLFYDLPGFKDTRGIARNLVNACFIKRIIDNAKSARLVFVAGADQITSDRGSSVKEFLMQIKQLIPNNPIENFSALIVTKMDFSINLVEFLQRKLDLTHPDLSMVNHWIDTQRIDRTSKPQDGEINYDNKESILKLIREMGNEKVENINIGAIYDTQQQMEIMAIYNTEIYNIIERLIIENKCGFDLISGRSVRFISENSTEDSLEDSLKSINSTEIGIFCKDGKLYGKVHDKEALEVAKPDGNTAGGFSLESYERIIRTLTDSLNIERFNVAIQQEEERQQALAAFNYDLAYESATLLDIEALLQFTALRNYITLDKASLERKKAYMETNFDQCLSSCLEESSLIKLLRPISEDIYQSLWSEKKQNLDLYINNIVTLLNEEIAKKNAEEAEQAAAVQAAAAQRARAAQAAAEAEAARLRRANDPSNELHKVRKEIGRLFRW